VKLLVVEILKFTKYTFLLHFILGVIFTILYWIPEISGPLLGISYSAEVGAFSMVVGAAAAGFTISSLFGFMVKEWKEVKIIVIAEIVWLILMLVAVSLNIAVFGLGSILTYIVGVSLSVLFLLSYLKQEEIL
jgi:hypothetical protein